MNAPAEQRSPEWFKQRVGMITASRVAAILGESAFSNPAKLMREMVREYLDEPKEGDLDNNPDIQRGVMHEEDAIQALEFAKGIFVKDAFFTQHPEVEWMGASPDGVASDNGNVEAKCPRRIKPISEKKDWWHQAQHQMFVTGRKHTWFVQWTEDEYQVDRIEADPDWWPTYGPIIEGFYKEYQLTIADPKKCKEHIEPLVQDMSDSPIWLAKSEQLSEINAQIKELEAQAKSIKADLVELADGKRCQGGGVIVFPTTRAGSVDTKKMEADGINVNGYRKPDTTTWTVRVQ